MNCSLCFLKVDFYFSIHNFLIKQHTENFKQSYYDDVLNDWKPIRHPNFDQWARS